MPRPASQRRVPTAIAGVRLRAVLAGVLLGVVAQALATQRPGDAFALAMALVMIASGAASFVMQALAGSRARGAAPEVAEVRGWVVALCLGIVAGMQGLSLLAD